MSQARHSQRMSLGVGVVGVAAVVLVVVAVFYGFAGRTRVQATQTQLQAAQQELARLRLRASALERETEQLQQSLRAAEDQLQAAQQQSGLLQAKVPVGAVSGPGLVIDLTEPAESESGPYAAAQVVHAGDLLELSNVLFAAGAKAIAVNGVRVQFLGSIECQGPQLLVRGKRILPPYRVEAVGDAKTLARALRQTGGVVERLRNFGVTVVVQPEENVHLPPLLSVTSEQDPEPPERERRASVDSSE